jgi:hypothetical protein
MWVTIEWYVILFISYFLNFTKAVAFLGVPAKLHTHTHTHPPSLSLPPPLWTEFCKLLYQGL